jgi:hypothetical protein
MSNNIITIDFTPLYKQRGRPKKCPDDKKPRISAVKATITQQQAIHKLATLKAKWNNYYKQNRERILQRKKELREAKERLIHEALGMKKKEYPGRKPQEIEIDKLDSIKCLHSKSSKTTE